MNPRRLGTVAARIVLAGWIVVWLAGFGLASIENTGAAPLAQRRIPPLGMDAELADLPRANAMGNAVVGKADVARGAQSATGTATDATATSDEHESIAGAVLADSSHVLPPETPPAQTE